MWIGQVEADLLDELGGEALEIGWWVFLPKGQC